MNPARWWALARKAMHRPPKYVAWRAWQEVQRQARRPWGLVRPRLLSTSSLLRITESGSIDTLWDGLAATPFFLHSPDRAEWASQFHAQHADEVGSVITAADQVLRHEFDLLGSGPVTLGWPLPWHTDFKTGRSWPLAYAPDIDYNELDQSSDVKVPWELSRCQHFGLLGQAYWLTGEDRYAAEFVSEVTDWIAANPWTRGVNWACTMDVALRAVSWIWGFHFFADAPSCQIASFRDAFLQSLFLHGEFIAANLEAGDVNGNHYVSDAVGLVFVGVLFGRSSAGRTWRDTGRSILIDEIESQVYPDGVDFEQAIAYHRLVLEAFLTGYQLLRLAGEDVPRASWARLERMLQFVAAYTKPDGRAPLIGDADDGRIQILGTQPIRDHRYLLSTGAVLYGRGDFRQAAGRFWPESFWLLGPGSHARFNDLRPASQVSMAFPDAGFYVLRGTGAHVIVDCGDVGMRGRGGHGHNDVLGFELFLGGMNVMTDCGAYLYTASREWRNRFRSTASHNVLQIDGEELNRFVHHDDLWRLQYDAEPVGIEWSARADGASVYAGHKGYLRLSHPVLPRRAIGLLSDGRCFGLRDTVTGTGRHECVWRFHVDPDLDVQWCDGDWRLGRGDRAVWFMPVELPHPTESIVQAGFVSPSYGRRVENQIIEFRSLADAPVTFSCLVALERVDRRHRVSALGSLGLAE